MAKAAAAAAAVAARSARHRHGTGTAKDEEEEGGGARLMAPHKGKGGHGANHSGAHSKVDWRANWSSASPYDKGRATRKEDLEKDTDLYLPDAHCVNLRFSDGVASADDITPVVSWKDKGYHDRLIERDLEAIKEVMKKRKERGGAVDHTAHGTSKPHRKHGKHGHHHHHHHGGAGSGDHEEDKKGGDKNHPSAPRAAGRQKPPEEGPTAHRNKLNCVRRVGHSATSYHGDHVLIYGGQNLFTR